MSDELLAKIGTALEMSDLERAELLDKTGWVPDFDWSALKTLAGFMNVYDFSPGITIFREGDPGYFMMLVVSGSVKVLKEADDGYDHVIAELFAAAPVGEMTLVDGENRSASIVTGRDTQILSMTNDSFEALGRHHPRIWGQILRKIAGLLSARLRKTSEDLVDVIAATGFDDERY